MKQFVFILFILSIASQVLAQNQPQGGYSRKQTLHKGNVLRKTATVKTAYHFNGGTRVNHTPKHPLSSTSSRTQPIVTKPFRPVQ